MAGGRDRGRAGIYRCRAPRRTARAADGRCLPEWLRHDRDRRPDAPAAGTVDYAGRRARVPREPERPAPARRLRQRAGPGRRRGTGPVARRHPRGAARGAGPVALSVAGRAGAPACLRLRPGRAQASAHHVRQQQRGTRAVRRRPDHGGPRGEHGVSRAVGGHVAARMGTWRPHGAGNAQRFRADPARAGSRFRRRHRPVRGRQPARHAGAGRARRSVAGAVQRLVDGVDDGLRLVGLDDVRCARDDMQAGTRGQRRQLLLDREVFRFRRLVQGTLRLARHGVRAHAAREDDERQVAEAAARGAQLGLARVARL
ncbi:conserved hypothetical protein, partial [Ricinus communis]